MKSDDLILKEITRMNARINEIYKQFGKDSRQAQHVDFILNGTGSHVFGQDVRTSKNGVPQFSKSKKAIERFKTSAEHDRILRRIDKVNTAGQQKQKILEAYKKRTGVTDVPKRAAKQAIEEEVNFMDSLENRLNQALQKMYELQRKLGAKFKEYDDIQGISRGAYTSQKDIEKMIEIAESTAEKYDNMTIDEFSKYMQENGNPFTRGKW